ncbi:MAG: rpfC [Phycisphaerales bacterium]|nr:rpfC [Phycisphaerales bacterium]
MDWSKTPLGPVDRWAACLRSLVDMLLAHPFPTILLWGPELIQIYNDGYRRIAAGKHPRALGQPTRECWPEAWHISGPIYERVLTRGESLSVEDQLIPLFRNGYLENCYFTVAYTPVRDEQGSLAGVLVTIFETTDERRAQQALRHTADHLSLALAAAKLGDWAWDANTDLMTMSEQAAKIFAVPAGTHMTRTSLRDMLHPEDRDAARLASERAAAGRSDYDIEYRVNRVDGIQVWVAAKGRGQYDPAGNITGMLGVLQDVTERKAAEAALRESEERLRLGLDAGNTGTWDWDIQKNHITWSDRVYEFHGVKPGQFGGRVEDFARHLHPDDSAWVNEAIQKSIRDRAPYEVTFRVIWPNGEVHWITTNGKVYYGPDGAPLRMLGATIDVTARKAAEAERDRLLASERAARADAERRASELDAVIDNMPDAVYIGDAQGIHKCNRRALEMLGFPDGDSLRRAISELAESIETRFADTGERIAPGQEPFERALSGEATVREVMARNIQTGQDLILRCAAAPIVRDGKVVGAVAVNTDVTDRRRAEHERERLLESERAVRADAERASHMKDEFLATLSHELRTPLNAILGWSQILRSGTENEDDLRQGLETIERNARAQTQIIEDLLDMSRIISGKVRLDVRRVELLPVIEAAMDTVRPAADAKGIRLIPVLDPHAGLVSADPGRLQQVFWNLLSNAIKFTPRGGRVQVVLERVESHVEATITDSGQGIKPGFLPHVFERFRQADASITRTHGGLGLGLAIVKQLVELHGGTVHAVSPGEGQGASFVVALPLTILSAPRDEQDVTSNPSLTSTAPPAQSRPSLKGIHVLVVDDEPDARSLMKRLLEDCEAQVITAASTAEALRAIAARPPDVLISDIGMPSEDGYALIRQVRRLLPTHGGNTPALALTAYARSEDHKRAIFAGFQMHIAKPVEPTELITMVASLAGRADGRGK